MYFINCVGTRDGPDDLEAAKLWTIASSRCFEEKGKWVGSGYSQTCGICTQGTSKTDLKWAVRAAGAQAAELLAGTGWIKRQTFLGSRFISAGRLFKNRVRARLQVATNR